MQYAMLILHDECIKSIPLKGLFWGARDTLLRNSPTLRSLPCWGNSTTAGKRQPLLGKNLLCTRSAWSSSLGKKSPTHSVGKQRSLTCWGCNTPDSAWETTTHRYLRWEITTFRPGDWGSINLKPVGDNHPDPARESTDLGSAGELVL